MENNIIESPIYYSGSKLKCIKKGLLNYFPKDINTLVDLFCGSGIISLNTNAKRYILNDKEKNLINLYNIFKDKNLSKKIEELINYYKLEFKDLDYSFNKSSKKFNKNLFEIHKNGYRQLRDDYNNSRNEKLLYLLTIYSFCHQMRFNSKGNFNMPIGHDKFINDINNRIDNMYNFINKDNKFITNKDFRELKIDKLNSNDFVYLDPPYLISTATYNENDGWTEQDEIDLYNLCDKLNKRNIKFGLSNVLIHKGKENTILKQFIKNYNVVDMKTTRSSLGKGNANSVEIYVYNYDL